MWMKGNASVLAAEIVQCVQEGKPPVLEADHKKLRCEFLLVQTLRTPAEGRCRSPVQASDRLRGLPRVTEVGAPRRKLSVDRSGTRVTLRGVRRTGRFGRMRRAVASGCGGMGKARSNTAVPKRSCERGSGKEVCAADAGGRFA